MADDEDATPAHDDAELGAAVDDAMKAELKRRFVQQFIGIDRAEGTGRGEARWNDSLYRDVGGPDDHPG